MASMHTNVQDEEISVYSKGEQVPVKSSVEFCVSLTDFETFIF
jgi:hypothetical protein